MNDFFSFEYFDDLPDDDSAPGAPGSSRRNFSLSSDSAEYLRDAVQRLVPSSYVYGESGIGERAYELFGLCVGHALTGKRSSKLLAALCIMYASFESRSDLVILPTDIEAKYANLRMSQLRLTNILCVYDDFCRLLKLPKLDVSMEKLLRRVFRQGCKISSEALISQFTDTALKFQNEIRSLVQYSPRKPTGKTNYRQKFRVETIAAVCCTLALRYHQYTSATAKSIQEELHVSKGALHYLLNKFKNQAHSGNSDESVPQHKGGKRTEPIRIAGVEVPAGVLKRRRDLGTEKSSSEEILAILPATDSAIDFPKPVDAGDSLSFLFDFGKAQDSKPISRSLPVLDHSRYEQSPAQESASSRTTSGWDDLL